MKKLLLICLILLSTIGCTSLDRLKKMDIQSGKGFNQELAKNYLEFSQSEADAYDWVDSAHFASKGLRSARGETVLPEELDNWDIPQEEFNTLKWARNRLMNVLTDKLRQEQPEKTAKAQYLFDCWVEQQEENWQPEDINACRSEFLLEVTELENKMVPEIIGRVKLEGSEAAALISPITKAVIYFESGSAKLNGEANKSIADIVMQSKEMKDYMIKIDGYTDTVGSTVSNVELSQSRANVVADRLVKDGVNPDSIKKTSYGESMPAKPTADNVAEPLNRRVEVGISGK